MAAGTVFACAGCGAANGADARFCNQCGAALQAVQPAGAERKHVTVLFSDVSGFTAASERLDPEEMREIMARIFARAAGIVARHEGRIEKFIGDAVMAIFGVPVTHEDDALRAVRAAIELHSAVAELSPQFVPRIGSPIAMHSGIASGLVVTGDLTFDHGTAGPLGSTVNLAARLMSAAPAGEVWIAAETRKLVGIAVEVDDLGRMAFKGKVDEVTVARVRGLRRPGVPAQRSRFVGRDEELDRLTAAQVRSSTGVTRVGILGEPGSGKSRLVAEFRIRLGSRVQWLEGRAWPHAQDTPFAPLIDLLARSWGIEETDEPHQVRDRITAALARELGDAAEASELPLFLHLFRLEQDEGVVVEREAFQQRLGDALRKLLQALTAQAPTVVCVQDLHWADEPTLTLIRSIGASSNLLLMLLVNYRPGFAAWPGVDEIVLGELSASQTREIVASLLGGPPPLAIGDFVAARSDGNPFYAEELVHTLVETGVLERIESGGWTMVRPPDAASIPSTVRGVIAARIDRLEAPHKEVLRDASVVGREFFRSIVAAVTREPAMLEPSLGKLQTADLVRQRRGEPDTEYWFKHALTHDVAYESLLKSQRQRLHGEVGRAIERLFGARIAEFVETLAFHYRLGGVADKAIRYLIDAGKACVARYALAEAGRHFRNGYTLLVERAIDTPRDRLLAELLIEWSHVHYYEGTINEWHGLLERHLSDVERCGDVALHALYLGWLGNVRLFRADMRGAMQIIDSGLDLGRGTAPRQVIAYLLAWRVHAAISLGRYDEAATDAQAVAALERGSHETSYPKIKAGVGLAKSLLYRGNLIGARRIAEGLVALGTATGNARATAQGHGTLAIFWILTLDFERAAAAGQEGIRAARDPMFVAMNGVYATVALALDMRFEEARALCERYVGYLTEGGNHWFGQPMRSARDAIGMAGGNYSDGMRSGLANIELARRQSWEESAFTSKLLLLLTYVSIARRDMPPSFIALMRNPWFLLTQAPFAAGYAIRLIRRLRGQVEANGAHGFDGAIDLAEARLLAHQGRHRQARVLLDRMRERLRGLDLENEPMTLARLAAELGGGDSTKQ
jgi:class 3 adenylate cyclase/tetratricopeptide (TPR) repeat protein